MGAGHMIMPAIGSIARRFALIAAVKRNTAFIIMMMVRIDAHLHHTMLSLMHRPSRSRHAHAEAGTLMPSASQTSASRLRRGRTTWITLKPYASARRQSTDYLNGKALQRPRRLCPSRSALMCGRPRPPPISPGQTHRPSAKSGSKTPWCVRASGSQRMHRVPRSR